MQGISGHFDLSGGHGYIMRVNYNQDYDIASNTSLISLSVDVYNGWYDYAPMYADGIILVNGQEVIVHYTRGGTNGGVSPSLEEWDRVGDSEKSIRISHNRDGTGSITISVRPNNFSYYYFLNDAYSWTEFCVSNTDRTYTLTTIPRASSLSSASNTQLNSNCSLSWVPNSTAFAYRIKFALGNWSYTTSAITPNKTSSYTYTGYKIPIDVAYQLPNSTSGTMTATLYTYTNSSCSTQLGSESSRTFTVTVPSNIIPSIVSVSASLDNSKNSVIKNWGLAVSGYTKIILQSTANGAYGSTIVKFTITGDYSAIISGSSLYYTGSIISSSGNKSFTIKVTDSRGRESGLETTNSVYFYPYANPMISAFSAERLENDNKKVAISAQWAISPVNNLNSAIYELKYKKSTVSSWTTYNGELVNGGKVQLSIDFDETSSYNFKLLVKDTIGNNGQNECFISTIDVLLDFRAGGRGLGVGKICETDSMEVILPAKFMNTISIRLNNVDITLADYIKGVMNGSYT